MHSDKLVHFLCGRRAVGRETPKRTEAVAPSVLGAQARLGSPRLLRTCLRTPLVPWVSGAFFPEDPRTRSEVLKTGSGTRVRGAGWRPSPQSLGGIRRGTWVPHGPAAGAPSHSRSHPAPATMPRKGTQPSTARRREEGPPQSPDGASSDAEPEPPPPDRAGSPAPDAAGE